MQDKEKRETLTDLVIELKHYYECQKQHKMYLVAEQTTHVISSLAIAVVMAVLLLAIFAFLGMAAAHWLSTLFGSLAMGFLFYALFLACVLGIFYMDHPAHCSHDDSRLHQGRALDRFTPRKGERRTPH